MNAARKSRRRGASIVIRRRKPGLGRGRHALNRRRRDSPWADAMLDVRTIGWLSRRLGRLYVNELAWRSRRRLGYLRR